MQPTYQGEVITCGSAFAKEQKWQLKQLQLYISDLRLVANQQIFDVKFNSNQYSSARMQLLGGVCGSSLNWVFPINTPVVPNEISSLEFTLGVPFALNHANPMLAKTPLNHSGMFWTWQTGYKFLRLELESANDDWLLHLGSTGCQSASPVRPPAKDCLHPNRPKIRLDNFDIERPINIELFDLLKDLKLTSNTSCQSSQSNPSCEILLPRLGINHSQQIFRQPAYSTTLSPR